MDEQTIRGLVDFCVKTSRLFYDFSVAILNYLTLPIKELVPPMILGGGILSPILSLTPIGNFTLIGMMLGGGITVYLTYQLVNWLLPFFK